MHLFLLLLGRLCSNFGGGFLETRIWKEELSHDKQTSTKLGYDVILRSKKSSRSLSTVRFEHEAHKHDSDLFLVVILTHTYEDLLSTHSTLSSAKVIPAC